MEHTITRLAREAARLSDVPFEEVMGPGHKRAYCRARWAVMLVAYRQLNYSSPDIGQRLGGRDHSTVLHGLKRAQALWNEDDTEFAGLVRGLSLLPSRNAGALSDN